jgi:hydroxymethylpyrimidine pyrophosphatase-like HAD family hydrolase
MSTVLRLAVVDVDGCLTPGEAREWNWKALQAISDFNRRAQRGEPVPAVTLCTGRQEPYIEVLMQAIGAYQPGIYENGCGLYFPDGYRFVEHPLITVETRKALAAAKAAIYQEVVMSGLGYFQPGKEVSLTLYPLPGITVGRLYRAVAGILRDHDARFALQASVSCVDVTPAGLDKGTGVRWLSDETGIPLMQMGGVGDSPSDLKFLRLLGRSAVPANAASEVRAEVDYVSPHPNGEGVVDILNHWIEQVQGP